MPSAQRRQFGGTGRGTPVSLLLFSVLFISFCPGPGHTVIYIPEDYNISDLMQPPVITAHPESYTAFTAEDIVLTCEASGNPPPKFRWVKDGQQFDPASDPQVLTSEKSGTFSVVSGDGPISKYMGKYRCYASNELGTAISEEAQLITENTPILTKEKRQRKTVEEGDKAILNCNPPSSSTPPNIHWMDKNLQHIHQSDRVTKGLDGRLYFSHVIPSDSRDDYICHAQYVTARTILPKEPIQLIVTPSNSVVWHRKPHLLHPTGSETRVLALRGQSLVLECIPKGLPTPSVTWQRLTNGVLSTSRTSTQNFGRWLRFNSIDESDQGDYECIANNSQGTAKHFFTVTVEAAPYWIKKPASNLYAPGENVRLECHAEGIPTPTITWSLNGNPLSGLDPEPRRTVHGGTLRLGDVTKSDTAVYQCEASNKHGIILVNTYIHVIELPPQILTRDMKVYRVTQGQTAVLDCETFGSPRPKIQWNSDTLELVLSHAWVSQLVNGSLQISNASPKDSGSYMCSVFDSNLSIAASLDVLNRTVIISPPEHKRVQRGKSVTLTCDALVDDELRNPPPQTLWRKDGQKLHESSFDDKYTLGSSLIVANAQSEDEGLYTCEVITELDMTNASGSITVVDRPDPPFNLTLTNKQSRSLTLSWIPGNDHNSPINEFVVEYEELRSRKGHWQFLLNSSGDIQQVKIPLQPFCNYTFRVTAFNEFGRSEPSNPSETYRTPPAAPDRNPEDVRTISTEPGVLTIAWKEMDKYYFNGPGYQYKVMWRAAGHRSHWNQSAVSSSPFVVREAGTFQPFEIKVKAVNQLGEGPDPILVTGHSGEDRPLMAPQNIAITPVNGSVVQVKWVPVSRDSVQGHLLGYKIYLRRLGPQDMRGIRVQGGHESDNGDSWVVDVSGSNQVEEVLEGLRPYSKYELKMTAYNSKGEGPFSGPHEFDTPEGVPGAPASLTFDSPSETSLTLHWSPPRDPNGKLIGYLLHYQEILESNNGLMKVLRINDPDVYHITLDNLDPKIFYAFYLSASTSTGPGESIVRTAATLLDGGPPSNITVTAGETNVNLSWVAGERYRNVVFYIMYLNKNGGRWEMSEMINSTQSFYQLQGLQSGSQYRLSFLFNNSTFWEKEIKTEGPRPIQIEGGFATQGWFIGLISAIVLLLLVLLILCFIKRSKGGKYSVKDKEEGQVDSEARPMKDDAFGEYSDNEEKRSVSQPSLGVESKLGSDDSLAGYGDSVDIQFNEDGSFIGQYSGHRDVPGAVGHDSSGATSPVNPMIMPPSYPGVPNSVTGILNRGN
ncbi:neural cell adhesion molecule L1.1-like isoform X3 [Scleropages formosus]|uniref:Neural cell adhesion molecule L1 n=1 Tax=Scleropages formosus TaxID=113540 RepID=A0A8C9RKQ6_SCLFO|nr:neural cell adhesion molecule L1.1-like isoform X3 [Scleropages formosus]